VTLVSFVIPLYQTRRFVREAVESALAQTHRPVEVIVVDDGSTDGGVQALRDLETGGRVRILSQAHAGTAAARNTGLRASRGEYLAFLDSDDRVDPRLVERLLPLVDGGGGCGLAYGSARRIDEGGEPIADGASDPARGRLHREGNLLPALAFGGFIQCNSVLVRRDLVERAGGFDERFGHCEDFHLWLRLSARGARARFRPETLASYRRRAESKSADASAVQQGTRAALESVARELPDAVAEAIPDCRAELAWIVSTVRRDGEEHVARCGEHLRALESRLGLAPSGLAAEGWREEAEAEAKLGRQIDELARLAATRSEAFPAAFAGLHEATARATGAIWRAGKARLQSLEARARELEGALARGAGGWAPNGAPDAGTSPDR